MQHLQAEWHDGLVCICASQVAVVFECSLQYGKVHHTRLLSIQTLLCITSRSGRLVLRGSPSFNVFATDNA